MSEPTFSLDDFGTDTEHRAAGCCPKCYTCAIHFRYFHEALDHVGSVRDGEMHRVDIHTPGMGPEAIHSCGCRYCVKWMEIN